MINGLAATAIKLLSQSELRGAVPKVRNPSELKRQGCLNLGERDPIGPYELRGNAVRT